jgi:hypothetical protein
MDRMRPVLRILSALLATLLLSGAARPDETGALASVQGLLSRGEAGEALALARVELEYTPSDVLLLDLASLAARDAALPDDSLRLATRALALALDVDEEQSPDVELVARLRDRIAALDPLGEKSKALLDSHAEKLIKLAGKSLDAIYANSRAEEALIDSGMDVPFRKKRLARAKLARRDAQFNSWSKPEEIKLPNYTVKTTMGYELGISMAQAMEQMNRFYRQIFQHKTQGGGTARCTIEVHKSREDFDAAEAEMRTRPNVRGFFSPSQTRVVTYDPRTDGRPISALWSTLFHEASHQFTHMISPGNIIPGWLNEGTASYFDGARLLPSGQVQTNLIPDGRLRSLKVAIERGSPTLKEVISFHSPGSYDGSYYSTGWGLVYFMQNFEDEKCERVYVKPYQQFLQSYRSGGKHDTFQRFEEIFVKRARQPGIKSFEDLEKRFREWILALYDLHFGPPQRADLLIDRARQQRSARKLDAALESYQWALRKRPGDAVAAFERAEVLEDLKRKDEAIFSYRVALGGARSLTEAEATVPGLPSQTATSLATECIARIRKLDKNVASDAIELDEALVAAASALASEYDGKSFPWRALDVLDSTSRLVGGHRVLSGTRKTILEKNKLDPRSWQRLVFDPELTGWSGSSSMKFVSRDVATAEATNPRLFIHELSVKGDHRFEITIEPEGELQDDGLIGITFGGNNFSGQKLLTIFGSGNIELKRREDGEQPETLAGLVRIPDSMLKKLNLAVEVKGSKAEFFLEGRSVGTHEFSPGELEGRMGFLLQHARARFSQPRVLHEPSLSS